MRKPKPIPTPAETIEKLQAEIDRLRCRINVADDVRRRLEREVAELADLCRAQARVMISPQIGIAHRDIPW